MFSVCQALCLEFYMLCTRLYAKCFSLIITITLGGSCINVYVTCLKSHGNYLYLYLLTSKHVHRCSEMTVGAI